MTRARDISNVITDANLGGTLDVSGAFTSQGIDDNADATAITIDSSERVGIGETSPQTKLHIKTADASATADSKAALILEGTDATRADLQFLGDASAFQQVIFGDNSDADVGRIAYDHGANTMRFNVNAAEAARITSDGLDFRNASGVKYVLFKDGDGLHFGAVLGSGASSSVLDDYEEGSWTPVLGGASSDPTVSYTGNNAGAYTKVGNVVHVVGRVNTTSVSGGSGTALIKGLPFATSGARNAGAVGYISSVTHSSGYTTFGLNPEANASTIRIVQSGSAIGGATVSIGNVGNTFDLTFSHTYRV